MDPLKVPASQETKLHFMDYWRFIRIRKTVILAVFLLVVITATLVTFILPESYYATGGIKAVEERLAEQEKKVRKASEEAEKLRDELKVPDMMAMENAPVSLMSADSLRKVEAMRIETKADYVRQNTLLNKLRSLKYEEL